MEENGSRGSGDTGGGADLLNSYKIQAWVAGSARRSYRRGELFISMMEQVARLHLSYEIVILNIACANSEWFCADVWKGESVAASGHP